MIRNKLGNKRKLELFQGYRTDAGMDSRRRGSRDNDALGRSRKRVRVPASRRPKPPRSIRQENLNWTAPYDTEIANLSLTFVRIKLQSRHRALSENEKHNSY